MMCFGFHDWETWKETHNETGSNKGCGVAVAVFLPGVITGAVMCATGLSVGILVITGAVVLGFVIGASTEKMKAYDRTCLKCGKIQMRATEEKELRDAQKAWRKQAALDAKNSYNAYLQMRKKAKE